ncbi:MAG: hypothetical protein SPJ27_09100 [Candidatus Onthovivens sp.]|nr:hypothetical protein [Candidatus Onthovivens sp.]
MTYQRLTSKEIDQIKEIEEITNTNYQLLNDLITTDSLLSAIDDLFIKIKELKKQNKELKKELSECKEEKTKDFEKNPYMYLGISRRDFY